MRLGSSYYRPTSHLRPSRIQSPSLLSVRYHVKVVDAHYLFKGLAQYVSNAPYIQQLISIGKGYEVYLVERNSQQVWYLFYIKR